MDHPKVQLAALLRFVVSFAGQEKVRTVQKSEAFIGRSSAEFPADIDLSLDTNVSRRHARIWLEHGAYWIEDLGSKGGTLVNGVEIKGLGKQSLPAVGATAEMGNTKVRVEIPADPIHSFLLLTPSGLPDITVDLEIPVDVPAEKLFTTYSITALQNLVQVLDLPMEFLGAPNLHVLLPLMLNRARKTIPAQGGAILLNSRNHDALHVGAVFGEPQLHESIARRALAPGQGLAWHANANQEFGLCVSLQSNGKKLGVICLSRTNAFIPSDLGTLIVLARFAACALEKMI